MKNLLQGFKEFFVDDTGALAMPHLMAFILFAILCFILIYSTITGKLGDFAPTIQILTGIIFGGQAIQSIAEALNKK